MAEAGQRDCYLVTGASAGLGALFCERLAARGCDLVIVARRADRLNEMAERLSAAHDVRVEAMPVDLTEPGAIARMMAEIDQMGIIVTHLINNAGFGLRGPFAELDGPSQARMVDLNCRVVVELAHAVLPGMIADGRGGILNVASTAAFQAGPWMAIYYASKAFVLSFSEALHSEVKHQGVHVSALCPGPTRTEFHTLAEMGDAYLVRFMSGDAEKVVADGLKALDRNDAVRVSGALNDTIAFMIRFTPRFLARGIAGALQKTRRTRAG